MRELDIQPDIVLRTAVRIGERFARLKPNGRLVRRSPLSDLIEVEGLLDAVRAKAAGWQALLAVDDPRLDEHVPPLAARADAQIHQLAELHRRVARTVLG